MQVAAVKQQLAAKATEADSLSRRMGAVNNLTTAFEQVRPVLSLCRQDIQAARLRMAAAEVLSPT